MDKNIDSIKMCEELYPETAAEFKKIMQEQYTLFTKKMLDYGVENISGDTALASDEEIRFSLMGLFFRTKDKVQRLKQLVVLNKENNVGEPVDDTYQDLTNYGIISQIVKRKKWGK